MDSDNVLATELYKNYGFIIYRTCYKILQSEDDAKDALQAVFLKLLENYATIENKERVVPWIFNAAKNFCYNALRFERKFRDSQAADETGCDDRIEKKLEAREILKLLFLNQHKKVRDAVYYTYAEHFNQQEIYKLTGQSPATIRRNLKKFRESLPVMKKKAGFYE